jgi:signal transduction histidine kinase
MERQLNIIKELEAGLIAAKEDAEYHRELAEHSSRAKSEFLSRMSHEMLTPMNSVMGMLQIMKIKGVPVNIKNCVDEINSATAHLLDMINDVLDVTGVEYGVFKLNEATFDVKSAIRDILETVEYNATQKRQILTTSIDSTIPSYLLGDEKRLKQVISNLLANAVKFTPDNGEISFSAKRVEENTIMSH